jgi:hypothetical protein
MFGQQLRAEAEEFPRAGDWCARDTEEARGPESA